jgi:two-component system cell cycle response regulator CpdR
MKPLRMLYVEDNAELRETFQEMLEGEQREVVACGTAEEALVLWSAGEFDVLVTDISLPGMSGTDLARRILAVQPDRWIVLCSGYQYGDALRALGPRVRALSKPFELEDLDRLMGEIRLSLGGAP